MNTGEPKSKRTAVIFHRQRKMLNILGENLTLAMKRRGITQEMMHIPVAFQVAPLLVAFAHPDHYYFVGSRGFAHLPPRCNLKCFGYSRTGVSKPTLRKISKGDPSVSLGHYIKVLAVLGLLDDLTKVARDDELGRKLQDIQLLNKK